MRNPLAGAFRERENFNFRLWTAEGLVSNIGTWMQRVTGLQFAPQPRCRDG